MPTATQFQKSAEAARDWTVTPLSATLGAVITGVDLSTVDGDQITEIRKLLH